MVVTRMGVGALVFGMLARAMVVTRMGVGDLVLGMLARAMVVTRMGVGALVLGMLARAMVVTRMGVGSAAFGPLLTLVAMVVMACGLCVSVMPGVGSVLLCGSDLRPTAGGAFRGNADGNASLTLCRLEQRKAGKHPEQGNGQSPDKRQAPPAKTAAPTGIRGASA